MEALAKTARAVGGPCVYIIDDNSALREALGDLLTAQGMAFETFESAEAYLEDHGNLRSGCLIVDAQLPGMSGIELMQRLQAEHSTIPAIMITGYGDINTAVSAMKAGAIDFMEKPIAPVALLAAINRALEMTRNEGAIADWRNDASRRIQNLTPREHQIMNLIISGRPNKIIASDLSISQRTVENHRAAIFRKTKSKSLSDLVRLSIAAA
jgi:two-component system CheB/CheR fusion protein